MNSFYLSNALCLSKKNLFPEDISSCLNMFDLHIIVRYLKAVLSKTCAFETSCFFLFPFVWVFKELLRYPCYVLFKQIAWGKT